MRADRLSECSSVNSGCRKLEERLGALNEQVLHARRVLSRDRLAQNIEKSGSHLEQAVITVIKDVDMMVGDITVRLASLTGAMHDISNCR